MDNSINFKGAFLVKQPTQILKNNILPALGRKKQIIENVSENGDVLYVIRNSHDRDVAKVLYNTKNAKFKLNNTERI